MKLTYHELRQQYPVFFYRSFSITETETTLEIDYHFEIPGLSEFTPHWSFPKGDRSLNPDTNSTLKTMIFSLGLVELISYWKLTCSPHVEIQAGQLDDTQIAWWKDQYFLGLGEFFYTNHIDASFDYFMDLVTSGRPVTGEELPLQCTEGCLVPVGGGKDSAVTLSLLKELHETIRCYIINPRGASLSTVAAAGFDSRNLIAAGRTLDRNMLELNSRGFLNGHTPYSAIVAFSSVIAAYLHGLHYSVLSNESSANESTVPGSEVNHQYSKSFKFEQDFHQYEQTYLKSGVYYFSLLRPFSELQIAACFARYPEYFSVFKSCNAGSKQDIWCCSCPKCLFVYLILSPFLSQEKLTDIFGGNLLLREDLTGTLEKLTGLAEEKPFECVGSREEVNTAVCMTIHAMEQTGSKLPPLLAYYRGTPLYTQYRNNSARYQIFYDSRNLLPERFNQIVRAAAHSLIPSL